MDKINLKTLKSINHKNGKLMVFEKSSKIEFDFKRVFYIKASSGQIRGKHAHKKCTQLLNCVNGKVEIICEDKKKNSFTFYLDKPEKFLVIPPMTWCVQKYKKNKSILMVICDQRFKKSDYIRSYKNFVKI